MSSAITIDELKEDISFSSDFLLDDQFLIIPAGVSISQEITKALRSWEFKNFSYEGNIIQPADPERDAEEKIANPFTVHAPLPDAERKPAQASQAVNESLEAFKISQDTSESARYLSVQKTYQEYMKYINSVYTHYSTHKKIDLAEMTETVQKLCIFIKENKRFVLRITPSAEARNKNFLVIHSMRSTVLAITIALELHIPLSKVVELGIATILHEIGMLRLPPQLYITDRALSAAEKKQISMHPIFSHNILKELNFPNSILAGVLDHHEKENGMGYPRGFTGDKISPYGKIISVACSFEAITAPRTYKTERTTYDAMVEMLQNPNKQYDPTIIKALLYSLSLYPIGQYVYLNNGKIGLVTDVTPNKPQNPIVQLVNEKDADGSPKTVQTDEGANKIIRPLTKQEQDDLTKKLEEKQAANQVVRLDGSAMNQAGFAPGAGAAGTIGAGAAGHAGQAGSGQAGQGKESEDGFSSVDLSEFS